MKKYGTIINICLTAIIVTFIVGLKSFAQIPTPTQKHTVAVKGATIHTVTQGDIPNGTILFQNGVITAIGNEVEISENTEIIEATGKHIYPGFVHARSTIGLMEISRIRESTDLREEGNINPNIRAQVAFNSISEHLGNAAASGVTTVTPATVGGLISGMPAAMMTSGWTWEQMTLQEGVGMSINWPSSRENKNYAKEVQELKDAFEKARRYKTAREAMKSGNAPHHPMDLRWEALLPVLNGDMTVYLSAHNLEELQAAISWAQDEEITFILVGNRDIDLIAPILAKKNIPVILTRVISGPTYQWDGYNEGYTTPAKLHEAGVQFCIAGDGSAANVHRMFHHAAAAVAFGLPNHEALKSITINAAQMLGIDNRVGSLEVGKDATFMITDGDPLELWTSREQVFIQGRKLDMNSKHKHLYERYLKKHMQEQAASNLQ